MTIYTYHPELSPSSPAIDGMRPVEVGVEHTLTVEELRRDPDVIEIYDSMEAAHVAAATANRQREASGGFSATCANPHPTTTGVEGGIDVDVVATVCGQRVEGGVTLVPDTINGGLVAYGDCPDTWVSGELLRVMSEASGGDELLRQWLATLRGEAAAVAQ